ncbi:helix-turn-helix domain-containing protein [Stappia stellulata]|nr:helix-turn-helix domain-containing protein [Stappia stellulata]
MDLEKAFGQKVRYWRKQRGLSQEEFAHLAQLHPTYVSGIESGKRNPTIKIVARIASALQIKASNLFPD